MLPAAIRDITKNCERVDVLATVPFLGRSGLFPGHVAWGYLQKGEQTRPLPEHPVRLVVHDVEAPANLELPRLGRQLFAGAPYRQLISLRGIEATPDQVLRRLTMADFIELHVHGLLDPRVSDAPSLVLSPNQEGHALLSARAIEQVSLARGPGVFLGACDGAQGASYWSLLSQPTDGVHEGGRTVRDRFPRTRGRCERGPVH